VLVFWSVGRQIIAKYLNLKVFCIFGDMGGPAGGRGGMGSAGLGLFFYSSSLCSAFFFVRGPSSNRKVPKVFGDLRVLGREKNRKFEKKKFYKRFFPAGLLNRRRRCVWMCVCGCGQGRGAAAPGVGVGFGALEPAAG